MTLFQGATDTAIALGLEPVGVVESWIERPMYHYLRPELTQVRYLGLETQPDLEAIAWLHPDVIVGARNRHTVIAPLLSRIAPTVIAEQLYDFKALLRLMAEATGREDQGEQLLLRWQRRVTDFQTKMARSLDERWPPTVSVISFRSNHARIYYGGFARTVLDELGFRTPASQQQAGWGIKLTSQESIPAMDAEAIFVFMVASDPSVMETFRKWTVHPLWQQLEAAMNQAVFRVDPVIWNMGGGYLAANRMLDELYAHYGLPPLEADQDCLSC
ncbi:ABC transporter substrate-binding protein [Marinobacter fonticola]|uniref:ABC transporter substrate-binding protein n=1 Tax=Marinobacter fonticola TaxID=2603215 RepID=UPI0022287D90|nr:iron-siderophore ABC transporter substrate-binding protein [Marinobacter fonticola]